MKYFFDFIEDLKKNMIYPAYLFFGPENYLRREALKRLRDHLLPGGQDDINYTLADCAETTLSEVLSMAEMLPFCGEKRLISVINTKIFTAENAKYEENALIDYLKNPTPTTCIVFNAGKQVDKRKKTVKELAKNGKVVEFSLLRNDDLAAWLRKQAQKAGKKLDTGVTAELLARSGKTVQALETEISKLIDYSGEKKSITLADVSAVTPANLEEDIFSVVDAIGEKNAAKAINGIKRLTVNKHPAPLILTMIARQFRLLLLAENAQSNGKSGNIAALLGVHPFVAKKITAQQKNFNRRQLIKSVYDLHELDKSIKTGRQEFLPGIECFILRNCVSANNRD